MKCFYELIDSIKCIMGDLFVLTDENKFSIEKLISYFGKVFYSCFKNFKSQIYFIKNAHINIKKKKMVINSFSISNENEGNVGTGIYLR